MQAPITIMRTGVILALAAVCLPTPALAGFLTTIAQQAASILGATVGDVIDGTQITAVTAISNQCTILKALLWLQADQLEKSGNEPDITKLTLNYITNNSFKEYNIMTAAEEIPKSSWFIPGHGVVVFVHGFTDSANGTNARNVSDAYLSRGPTNFVALNASSLIGFFYLRSSTYTTFIGEALGNLTAALYKAGVSPSLIHLVGHSLGAHICGHAGKYFYNQTGVKVSRITGLDPAGPCFTNLNSSMRLTSTDADNVVVIHTNAGVLGLNEKIGHVDYSPNGGSSQPGCLLADCSHGRVVQLYAESVQSPDSFPAVRCNSWAEFRTRKCNNTDTSLMGYGSSNTTRGEYYLQTTATSPYALGASGTTYMG